MSLGEGRSPNLYRGGFLCRFVPLYQGFFQSLPSLSPPLFRFLQPSRRSPLICHSSTGSQNIVEGPPGPNLGSLAIDLVQVTS